MQITRINKLPVKRTKLASSVSWEVDTFEKTAVKRTAADIVEGIFELGSSGT